jgi:hypothetical protein
VAGGASGRSARCREREQAAGLCASDFAVLEALLHKGALPVGAIGEKVVADERFDHDRR